MLGVFGNIRNPFDVLAPGTPLATSTSGQGIIVLVSNIIGLAMVMAGIYTLFNLILAGYGFISAGGDSKLITKSWERIWRSILGLVIIVGSLLIAGIIGYLVYGPDNWNLLISPKLFTS